MGYESALVGSFMYSWGYKDAQNGYPVTSALLDNSQNPLDSLIGDLIGAVAIRQVGADGLITQALERRWFLLEFKVERKDFHTEVHHQKPHRADLYREIRDDQAFMHLSRFGHFGIWQNPASKAMVIEPYCHVVGPGVAGGPGPGIHPMDYKSAVIEFPVLYDLLHEPNLERGWWATGTLYRLGLGLPAKEMQDYLGLVLEGSIAAGSPPGTSSTAARNLIFGCAAPGLGASLRIASFEGLLDAFSRFSRATHQAMQPTHPPLRRDD